MKKILVIGCPGSGKSTFSRALHIKTNIPLYHLDMLNWNPDRTIVSKPVFIEKMRNILKQDLWIIDGNYNSTIEMRLQACDTVFFLDYPVEICLEGINSRKGKKRDDMPWIEKEDEEDIEFVNFVKNYHKTSKPVIMKLLDQYSYKNIVIFQAREEAAGFLEMLNKNE